MVPSQIHTSKMITRWADEDPAVGWRYGVTYGAALMSHTSEPHIKLRSAKRTGTIACFARCRMCGFCTCCSSSGLWRQASRPRLESIGTIRDVGYSLGSDNELGDSATSFGGIYLSMIVSSKALFTRFHLWLTIASPAC